MQSNRSSPSAKPILRLVSDQEADQPASHQQPLGDDQRAELYLSLREIYERYFVPLHIRPKALAGGTDQIYRDALDKWDQITGGPPIAQIDEFTTADFVTKLLDMPGRKAE